MLHVGRSHVIHMNEASHGGEHSVSHPCNLTQNRVGYEQVWECVAGERVGVHVNLVNTHNDHGQHDPNVREGR